MWTIRNCHTSVGGSTYTATMEKRTWHRLENLDTCTFPLSGLLPREINARVNQETCTKHVLCRIIQNHKKSNHNLNIINTRELINVYTTLKIYTVMKINEPWLHSSLLLNVMINVDWKKKGKEELCKAETDKTEDYIILQIKFRIVVSSWQEWAKRMWWGSTAQGSSSALGGGLLFSWGVGGAHSSHYSLISLYMYSVYTVWHTCVL